MWLLNKSVASDRQLRFCMRITEPHELAHSQMKTVELDDNSRRAKIVRWGQLLTTATGFRFEPQRYGFHVR